MLTNAGKFKEAINVYNTLEEKYGVSETLSMQKESLFIRMGDIKNAALEIQKLISIDSTNIKYHGILGELYEANYQYDLALKAYESLIKIDSTNQEGLLALAEMYKKTGNEKKYQEIIHKVFSSKTLDLDTKIFLFIPYIEEVASDSSIIDEVLALSDLIITSNPDDPKSYTARGDVYYNTGNIDLALQEYIKAVNTGSCPATVWYQVFQLLAEKENYEEIIHYTEKSKKDIGEEVLPYFYKGIACQQKKDYICAIEEYKQALKRNDINAALKAQIFSNLGDTYNETNQYEQSDSAFEQSLIIDPNNAFVLNNYSYYLSLRKDNLETAKSMSKKSNLLIENSPSFQDTYAWILYQLGEYNDAKDWIEKAISNMQEENEKPILLEHYGDILFKLGDIDNAVVKWQKALDAGGEIEPLEQKIKTRSLNAK
jgi:tetratricopeptide (TPR) repeat protein